MPAYLSCVNQGLQFGTGIYQGAVNDGILLRCQATKHISHQLACQRHIVV